MSFGIAVLFMIFGAAVSAGIAARRNRNVVAWGICGALFPLISVLAVAFAPALPTKRWIG